MNLWEDYPNNPFLPGHPVSQDYFIGRKDEVNKLVRYLPRVIEKGLPEHFFIVGKRGMGKTSFINYISNIANEKYDMFSIYVNNEGTNTIDELISKLLDKLFKEFNKTNWGRKIINNFFKHFDKIDIWGLGFEFRQQPEIVSNVKNNFIDFLVEICSDLKDYKGIFIIIDDINGLSETPDFANWYKALFETLEFYAEHVPIVFNLVTYPAKFEQLCEQNPSFPRMFNLIEIDRLDDDDVKLFFENTLSKFSMDFTQQYFQDMIYFTCGMPLVMQQIGDSIYWNLEKNCISEKVVYRGIEDAARELKNKPLKSTLSKVNNPHYNSVLLKVGENKMFKFCKKDLDLLVDDVERNILDDFLNRMLVLGILEFSDDELEMYEFVNIAFLVYFLICSKFKRLL